MFRGVDCLSSLLCRYRTVHSSGKYSVHVVVGDLIQDSRPDMNMGACDRALVKLKMDDSDLNLHKLSAHLVSLHRYPNQFQSHLCIIIIIISSIIFLILDSHCFFSSFSKALIIIIFFQYDFRT